MGKCKTADEQLVALDSKYLTPRILGGIPSGDIFAVDARNRHELAAIPLRGGNGKR